MTGGGHSGRSAGTTPRQRGRGVSPYTQNRPALPPLPPVVGHHPTSLGQGGPGRHKATGNKGGDPVRRRGRRFWVTAKRRRQMQSHNRKNSVNKSCSGPGRCGNDCLVGLLNTGCKGDGPPCTKFPSTMSSYCQGAYPSPLAILGDSWRFLALLALLALLVRAPSLPSLLFLVFDKCLG
jgi:hypothetical protein